MNNDNWSKKTEEKIERFLQRHLDTQKKLQDLKVYVYHGLLRKDPLGIIVCDDQIIQPSPVMCINGFIIVISHDT